MAYRHMRYPDGKSKAVTFSYDDGVIHDIRLAEMMNHHGAKCTYNINTSPLVKPTDGLHLTMEDIQKYILAAGHEVAIHGHNHKAPGLCTPVEFIQDVLNCRLILEEKFDRILRGMAYPDSGITNTAVTSYSVIKQCLIDLGIVYSRTLSGDNDRFRLPEDWHAWVPTAHHENPKVIDYAKAFTEINTIGKYPSTQWPRLFYLWGHSYEFANNNNWQKMESLLHILCGKEDTWYATNIEIYEYVQAYRSLVFSADDKRVYNPTLKEIWFTVEHEMYSVAPGQTLII